MFSGCIVLPASKEIEAGSSSQGASPSAGKNTRGVLVPYRAWKCVPTAISSGGVDIPRSLCVICYDRSALSEGHKNYFKDWCLMNSQPTFLFLN